ncbi:hypothetical protein BKP56_06875 [Marinilactibacillus sp. 15R]|uniref:hypothetical protein n=1 Tax=Marinilactibacillus sp. 15R TaxID=1911586 RepID=UPI00090B72C4|nr:hypothetical protein [Marinilactibacillus sp. 15R]API88993.1 hypothetical protein BKP56_06875 [Marinilactibacillus sp. 15R]
MEDQILALAELRRDLLFEKIPRSQYDYYIENAINIGKNAAKPFKDKKIKSLYKEFDITLSYSDKANMIMNFQLRAEFVKKKNKNEVVLYTKSLEALTAAWNQSNRCSNKVEQSDIEDVHLAHEFHHFLEYNIHSPVEKQLKPIEIPTLFGNRKKKYIKQCSEIACHAFAKELTEFPYFPTILDLVFLESKGELDAEIAKEVFELRV